MSPPKRVVSEEFGRSSGPCQARGHTNPVPYFNSPPDVILFARDCRAIMMASWYRPLFPTRLASARSPLQELVTTRGGFRLATSVGGVLTGRGADLIVIDDPLKPRRDATVFVRLGFARRPRRAESDQTRSTTRRTVGA